jgi:hypothetical protein
MKHELRKLFLGMPTVIWIVQLLYTLISLTILTILLWSFTTDSIPETYTRSFIIIYVTTFVVANIIWRVALMKKRIILAAITVAAAMLINVGTAQYYILQNAHSSFDNYYKFRGCSQLISRSSDNAVCRLSSGETIKIVKFHDRWYLDGDLPDGWLSW